MNWLLMVLTVLALAVAVPARAADDDPFEMISVEEVAKALGQPGVAVLDANNPKEFEKNHVPGAVFVTGKRGDDLAKLLPAEKDAKLIFYCYNPK